MSSVREIRVVDRHGDELSLFEFTDRRFTRKVRRLKLCTGELVEAIDADTFVILETGETLKRIG